MRLAFFVLAAGLCRAQNLQSVVKEGEQVFAKSCATGYCHGVKGGPGGAPRLAARGFDQAYINVTVTRGLPGTAMKAFGPTLGRGDLNAVVAYVATLNGIASPALGGRGASAPAEPSLPPDAARGRELFFDAVRGFARCATCHEVSGTGIAVATPIAKVPADVAALRALATPGVSTAAVGGESMPALVLNNGSRSVIFYDLTLPPPVLRTVEPSAAKITPGSGWKHSSVLGAYTDTELASVLAYLRTATRYDQK